MTKKVGVLVGSLRDGSFTRSVADKLIELLPEGIEGEIIEIADVRNYNEDWDTEAFVDDSYEIFRTELNKADAFIFALPEYNRSVPGFFKNAIDVGSRPYGQSKFDGKPALVVGVSPGSYGAFGANHHLRQALTFLNMPVVQQPEAYIGNIMEYIEEGKVTNAKTIEKLQEMVDALVDIMNRY